MNETEIQRSLCWSQDCNYFLRGICSVYTKPIEESYAEFYIQNFLSHYFLKIIGKYLYRISEILLTVRYAVN